MPRLDSTSLRYVASVASILVGVALLVYVALPGDDKDEASAVIAPTTTPLASASPPASAVPTATPEPIPPTPAVPLVKGTEADCFRGWRFLDNATQRWTVCLPANLLAFNGREVTPIESLTPAQQTAIQRDFAMVNEAWYLAQPGSTTSDVLAPLSLKIEVIAPTTSLDGCALRQQTPSANGTVSCTDRLEFNANGQPQFTATGSYQRFRALTPIQAGKSTMEAFSLSLTVYSYSSNSALQQRLFTSILESLKSY